MISRSALRLLALRALLVALGFGVAAVVAFAPLVRGPGASRSVGRRSLAQLFMETFARRVIDANVGRFILLREHRPGETQWVSADGACGVGGRRFRRAVDEEGFIRPSRVHDSADVNLFFLGGSTTECELMEEQQRFPYVVGRRLEGALGLRVNSFNGGVAGNESMHSITALLGKVLRLSPTAVVMMEDINDVMILMSEGSYWYTNSFKSHLQTSREVFSLFERPSADDASRPRLTPERASAMRSEFEANLRTFVAIARARRVLPVLMTQENRIERTTHPLAGVYSAFNQTTRDVSAAEGVPLVDLAREIPQDARYVCDLVHFSGEGSLLAADVIARVLEPEMRRVRDVGHR